MLKNVTRNGNDVVCGHARQYCCRWSQVVCRWTHARNVVWTRL